MAGKRTTASGEAPTEKEIRIPSKGTMRTFNEAMTENAETKADAAEALKDASDVAKKGHLYVPAFKVAKSLYDGVKTAKNESIAAEKLAKWLAQFDHARKFFKLDELAKLQGRLFAEGAIGGEEEEPAREMQEDGEPDDRPRHLRQPGASAAAAVEPGAAARAVQDLAAKSGAQLRDTNEEDVNKIGRGPTGDTKH